MNEKEHRGGRREKSGRKRIWTNTREGACMRMRKMRAKQRETKQRIEKEKREEENRREAANQQQQQQQGNTLQILKKRVRQLETENMQLKMRQFEEKNAQEIKRANDNTQQSSMTTQEELDRVQLTEGEYLLKYPRRRVNPARGKYIGRT
jgi:hypothetical protein